TRVKAPTSFCRRSEIMWRLREVIPDRPLVVLRLAQERLGKWIVVVMQSCRQSAHFCQRIRERSRARIVSRESARSRNARNARKAQETGHLLFRCSGHHRSPTRKFRAKIDVRGALLLVSLHCITLIGDAFSRHLASDNRRETQLRRF